MVKLAFQDDLENFLVETKIPPATADFLRQILKEAKTLIPNLEEEWLSYWPAGYSDTECAFLEFSWEANDKILGFSFAPNIEWLESYRNTSNPEAHKARMEKAHQDKDATITWLLNIKEKLVALPKPEASEIAEVTACLSGDNQPCVQVSFTRDIAPEPWEEGSSGFDL